LRRLATEFLAQPDLDLRKGTRGHAVLQGFQLLAKGIGKQVGHDADELADLDEKALQIDDGGQHALGVLAVDPIRQVHCILAVAQASA